jgi:hypothetical protein
MSSFARLDCSELASPHVFGVGDWLEVLRVDASGVPAQVVYFKSCGDLVAVV